jgi:ribonuclease J
MTAALANAPEQQSSIFDVRYQPPGVSMNALVYLPLGGADEIGMNMYLYGYGPRDERRWIMVDCGIGFPDAAHAPGVEIMTPDPAFIAAQTDRLDGIFITHAHEDHIGAVGRLWGRIKAPIYCTKFPGAIARRKLDEFGVSPKNLNICEQNTPVKVGDFTVSFFPMTHSIPETSALVIDTPLGRVFHTADFKIDDSPAFGDPMDRDAMRKMAEEGVLAIACDSTM